VPAAEGRNVEEVAPAVLELVVPNVAVLVGDPVAAHGPVVNVWAELPVWHAKNCTCPVGGPPTELPDTVTESVTVPDGPRTTVADEMVVAVVVAAWVTRTHSSGSRFDPEVLSSDPL
jgi:hypothetical protein